VDGMAEGLKREIRILRKLLDRAVKNRVRMEVKMRNQLNELLQRKMDDVMFHHIPLTDIRYQVMMLQSEASNPKNTSAERQKAIKGAAEIMARKREFEANLKFKEKEAKRKKDRVDRRPYKSSKTPDEPAPTTMEIDSDLLDEDGEVKPDADRNESGETIPGAPQTREIGSERSQDSPGTDGPKPEDREETEEEEA